MEKDQVGHTYNIFQRENGGVFHDPCWVRVIFIHLFSAEG